MHPMDINSQFAMIKNIQYLDHRPSKIMALDKEWISFGVIREIMP